METIVMTLLVRRVPEENAKYPYAVQISLPHDLTPRAPVSLAAVRLIKNTGTLASVLETADFYHPHEWRAALLSEQTEYAAAFVENPKPWYCALRTLTKNVYDFPGSGDRERNNGQVWEEFGDPDMVWTNERKLRGKCQEELDAEWSRRIAQVTRVRSTEEVQDIWSASWKQVGGQATSP